MAKIYDIVNKKEKGMLTNLVKIETAAFTNMSAPVDGVLTFEAGQLALTQHSMPTPVYGHKYYGRCYQKSPAGHTWEDARFEYYAEDVAGTGLMVFGFMEPTNNEWKILSSIQELTGEPTGSTWALRSFVSGGNETSYRKEMIIVDLTEIYGKGNEPTKEWCDENIPYFEGTYFPSLDLNDIIWCNYCGEHKQISLPAGQYKLECLGAQGGGSSNMNVGGRGGYAAGTLTLTEPTKLFMVAGGKGARGKAVAGGYNGGGASGNYSNGFTGSGGGGSDIRIGTDSLYARVLVAGGGGGGAAYTNYYGGPGGGTSGGASSGYNTTYNAKAGTATAGGAAGGYPSCTGSAGSFGQGGAAKNTSTSYNRAGGGGGGWYGGGGGGYRSNSSFYYYGTSGGGGGSGYAYSEATAANYPSGCLLDSRYYLTDTVLTTAAVSSDSGHIDTLEANSGDGLCKITVLSGTDNNVQDSMTFATNDFSIKHFLLNNNKVTAAYLGDKELFPYNDKRYEMLYDGSLGDAEKNKCTEITGGWEVNINKISGYGDGVVTFNTDHILVNGTYISGQTYAGASTKKPIDLTGYKYVYIISEDTAVEPASNSYGTFWVDMTNPGYGEITKYATRVYGTFPTFSKKMWRAELKGGKGFFNSFRSGFSSTEKTSTSKIYEVFIAREDNWQGVCRNAGINPDNYTDEMQLCTDYEAVSKILSNKNAVEYMLKHCTGSFMIALISNVKINALKNSPYYSSIYNNEHYRKFLSILSYIPMPDNTTVYLSFEDDLTEPHGLVATVNKTDNPVFVQGAVGKAISLDGTQGITIPYNAAFNFGTSDWAVGAWFYRPSIKTVWESLFRNQKRYNSSYTYAGWNLAIDGANDQLEISVGSSYSAKKTGYITGLSAYFPANKWTHIACAKRRTSFRVYIDGVQRYSVTLSSSTVYNPETYFYIGCGYDSSTTNFNTTQYFTGAIDEFFIVKGASWWNTEFYPEKCLYGGNDKVSTSHTPVEYITCQGNEFVDTEIAFSPNTKIEMEVAFQDVTSTENLWCARGASSTSQFTLFKIANQFRIDYNATQSTVTGTTITAGTKYKIKMDKNKFYVNDALIYTHTAASFTPPSTGTLMASWETNHYTNRTNYGKFKLYSCKIYNNDVLQRDFIPVQNSSGVYALYDKVSQKLFYNECGTRFVGEVPDPFCVTRAVLD